MILFTLLDIVPLVLKITLLVILSLIVVVELIIKDSFIGLLGSTTRFLPNIALLFKILAVVLILVPTTIDEVERPSLLSAVTL